MIRVITLFNYKYFILLFLFSLLIILYLVKTKLENIYEEIEKYIKFNLSGNLNHSLSEFYKRKDPKISIIISTFNGEVYLKPAIRSIQNQNFLNIEIIIVDDGSIDNTVKVVNELMKEDRRIILISNEINRGTLYTKTKGVLNAKGHYLMTLDHDNLYGSEYAFSKLYNETKKYDLDLLGFSTIGTRTEIKNIAKSDFLNYFGTKVIKKPYIQKRFLGSDSKIQSAINLCLYFIKTKLFLFTIKQLGEEFINRNIDAHDDTILMFMLSRNALTLKHLKEIFYILLIWPEQYSESLIFQRSIKNLERDKKNCYSYLTLNEILLKFTENNDKIIAENHFLYWFIRQDKCKNQTDIMNDTIRICNLYLKNEYISKSAKKEISLYLNRTKNKNKKIFDLF